MRTVKGEIVWENGYVIPSTTPCLWLELDDESIAQMPYTYTALNIEMAQHPTTP
jgi:hypothetical protein